MFLWAVFFFFFQFYLVLFFLANCRSIPQTIQLKSLKLFHRTKKMPPLQLLLWMNKIKIKLHWNHRIRSQRYWSLQVRVIIMKIIVKFLKQIRFFSICSDRHKSSKSCNGSAIRTSTAPFGIPWTTAATTYFAFESYAHATSVATISTSAATISASFR